MPKLPNNETTLSLGRAVSRLLALKRYMRKPNQGQLSAVKMGHLQTTITKLSWGQVHHPSFRRHFTPKLSDLQSVYPNINHPYVNWRKS